MAQMSHFLKLKKGLFEPFPVEHLRLVDRKFFTQRTPRHKEYEGK
jgi:hypothetical protein